jgi:hypothetical protein
MKMRHHSKQSEKRLRKVFSLTSNLFIRKYIIFIGIVQNKEMVNKIMILLYW